MFRDEPLKVIVNRVPLDEGGGYRAEVPDLPGCVTRADTYPELITNIKLAVEEWLDDGEDGDL